MQDVQAFMFLSSAQLWLTVAQGIGPGTLEPQARVSCVTIMLSTPTCPITVNFSSRFFIFKIVKKLIL